MGSEKQQTFEEIKKVFAEFGFEMQADTERDLMKEILNTQDVREVYEHFVFILNLRLATQAMKNVGDVETGLTLFAVGRCLVGLINGLYERGLIRHDPWERQMRHTVDFLSHTDLNECVEITHLKDEVTQILRLKKKKTHVEDT